MSKTFMCPYIQCDGNARDMGEYYTSVFGGSLKQNTFGEFGNDSPEMKDKIMHAELTISDNMRLMLSDNPGSAPHQPGGPISVTIFGDDDAEIMGYWDKLQAGSSVLVPMESQVWGDKFGMLTDKFGISWQMNISKA